MNLIRIHEFLAARKDGMRPEDLAEWRSRDLASLACLLSRRAVRGALLRPRLGRASGAVYCERGARVLHARYITAGCNLNIEEGAMLIGISHHGLTFGDRCTVGRFAIIAPTNPLGGVVGEGLSVGDNSNIGPLGYVGCSGRITIGSGVLMGPNVSLLAERHLFDDLERPIKRQGVRRSFITIEDDCWLGAGCVVLDGVTIGHGSVVAAGAVVNRDVEPLSIVAGVPARTVRSRQSDT